MAKLKLKTTILSKLSTLTRSEGNLVITRDGETLYFDTDTKRFKISDFIDVADDNDRLAILAPNTEKMYYVLSTNAVWRYISGTWYEVTSTEDVSDILSSLSNKADANKAYLTDDSNGTDVVDDDYIPFYDTSASAKKKSTFSNFVAKIKAKLITDTYSGTSTIGMSGKAVKSAIDALYGIVTGSPSASKTLTAFSQTDGKVSATFGDINISKSQINDFPTIPTVNNATLTIQKNGTNVQTFTANASSNKTANITVPTTQADLTEVRLTNEDLDDVTYPGFYYAGGGNTVTNKPTGYNNFGLVVVHNASGNQYTQVISNENGSYRRIKKADGTWTSWAQDNFTDTTYTAGTNVSIDANNAISAVDEKVSQEKSTSTSYFPILFANSTNDSPEKAKVQKNMGLTIRPSTANLVLCRENTGTSNVTNTLTIGNNIADGTTGSVRGCIKLFSKNTHCINLYSDEASTDLSYFLPKDKPNNSILAVTSDIPTVNDATLTITQNGTSMGTFTANQSTNNTIEVKDEKVTQTNNTANTYLPFLLANSTTSPETKTVKKATNITANPSNGYIDVNSVRIHSNVTDHTSNFARLYSANTADRRYKLPVDKDNDSELAVVADIPTVNDATLTITQNGTSMGTFTANQSTNNTIEVKDEKVTQTNNTDDKYYRVLLSSTDNNTEDTNTVNKSGEITVNPSTGRLRCKRLAIENDESNIYPLYMKLTDRGVISAGQDVRIMQVQYKTSNGSSNYTHSAYPISVIGNDAGNANNTGVRLGSHNGTTIVGAGESSLNFASAQSKYNNENLYMTADGSIELYTGLPNEATSFGGHITVNSSGNITVDSANGEATTAGNYNNLVIGNNKGTYVAGHKGGRIYLYSDTSVDTLDNTTSYSAAIVPGGLTAARTFTLPDKSGIVATRNFNTCVIGDKSSEVDANQTWYKVATWKITDNNSDTSSMIAVSNTYTGGVSGNQNAGLLYLHFRTYKSGTYRCVQHANLNFVSNKGFNVQHFALVWKDSYSTTEVEVALYTSINVQYLTRRFTFLDDGTRINNTQRVMFDETNQTKEANPITTSTGWTTGIYAS